MLSRSKQRLGGCLIAFVSVLGTVYVWREALYQRVLYEEISMLMPTFFVVGVALILFPGYKEERIARGEDITNLKGWKLLTPRWRVIFLLALAGGIANGVLLRIVAE